MQTLLFTLDAPLFATSSMLLNQHTSVPLIPLFGSISKLALIFYGGHPSLSIGMAYLSMMCNLRRDNPDVTIISDASGSWGCGAYCLAAWFQYQWPPGLNDQYITIKELLPIVIAVAIWGAEWVNKTVLCRDNEAVVHIIQEQAKTH